MQREVSNTNEELADEILVVSAILGDLPAFEELVLRYRDAVIRLAASIVGTEDAEDVAQDSWLLAFKALPSIENPTKFASWLRTITRHRAFRYKKQKNKTLINPSEFDAVLLEQFASLIPHNPENEEEEVELQWALSQIPNDYALVIQMHFFDDLPLKRIASFLSVSISTVKWRIYHGKKLLRKQLIRNN